MLYALKLIASARGKKQRFDSGSSHIYALFVVVAVVVAVVVTVVVDVVVSAICDDLRLSNLAVAACH